VAETVFEYGVEPVAVAYSGGERELSVVTLTLSATNRSGRDVVCPEILVSIPTGTTSDDLVLDGDIVTAGPDSRTPWTACLAGQGLWRLVPLPPAVGLADGQRAAFVLSNVVVNHVAGRPAIRIEERTDHVRSTAVVVDKSERSHHGGERPVVRQFAADPTQVALGANVTLSWRVDYALSGVLEPDGVALADVTQGSVNLPVFESTVFTLVAVGAGGSTLAPAPVTVMPVEIQSFTAQPQDVEPDAPVTLSWFTHFASGCSIDQGVGPVPRSGQTIVRPRRTTIYTLRADGLNPRTRAVTVTVAQPFLPTRTEERT
jgi:hypothetical protein